MKKMKKIMAMLLAMVMVLGMTVTAMAETKESAKITIENAKDATFKYVQVIEPNQTTKTGWAFTTENIKKIFVDAFGKTGDLADQDVIQSLIDGRDNQGFMNTSELADALSKVVSNVPLSDMTNPQIVSSAGVYVIKGNETGYTYNNMAAYVGFGEVISDEGTFEYPSLVDVTLSAKKGENTVEKINEDENDAVGIGDEVVFTVKTTVPMMDVNAQDKSFIVTDTLTGAEYVKDSIVITVAGQSYQIAENALTWDDAKNSFTVDLSNLIDETNSNAGEEVVITYRVIVTEETVNNEAKPSHVAEPATSKLYTGNITLTKYNEDESEKLANAGFEVREKTIDADTLDVAFSDALTFTKVSDGVYVYDPEGQEVEVFTNGDGTVTVKGLDEGTYVFNELTAPKGYSINENGAEAVLKVTEEGGVATSVFTTTAKISDTKLSSLPSTGGIGTTIFTIGGCAIMIAAAGLFFASRRKANK